MAICTISEICRVVPVVTGSFGFILPRNEVPLIVLLSPLELDSSLESVEALVIESRCFMGTSSSPASALMIQWVLLKETRFTGAFCGESIIMGPDMEDFRGCIGVTSITTSSGLSQSVVLLSVRLRDRVAFFMVTRDRRELNSGGIDILLS